DYAQDLLDAELVVKQGERILIKLPVFDIVDTNQQASAKTNMATAASLATIGLTAATTGYL
ncbi:MAG: hypothetical protein HOP37_05045, partial [Cyclobacteriaceae bacterium]|nr:hypothetical protein [Cyclobacteriaceae bacterium]